MKRLADLVVDEDAPPSEPALPFPASSLAKPPITPEEAKGADHATCRLHHGHISHTRVSSDTEGKVFWCPKGRMYWRFTKQLSAFMKPLPYLGGGVS